MAERLAAKSTILRAESALSILEPVQSDFAPMMVKTDTVSRLKKIEEFTIRGAEDCQRLLKSQFFSSKNPIGQSLPVHEVPLNAGGWEKFATTLSRCILHEESLIGKVKKAPRKDQTLLPERSVPRGPICPHEPYERDRSTSRPSQQLSCNPDKTPLKALPL